MRIKLIEVDGLKNLTGKESKSAPGDNHQPLVFL